MYYLLKKIEQISICSPVRSTDAASKHFQYLSNVVVKFNKEYFLCGTTEYSAQKVKSWRLHKVPCGINKI